MGHRREDLTSHPVLFWPVGAYLAIYRAERHPIEIVAVTQGPVTFRHSCAAESATDPHCGASFKGSFAQHEKTCIRFAGPLLRL
jgi:hypothetical protein